MISLHGAKTTYSKALRENGLYMLDQLVITAEVSEDIFGNYDLNIELELREGVPTDLYKQIQVDNIIKVNDEYSEEIFRIAQINKSFDSIEIYARHITIADSLNLWLDNVRPTNLNGVEALQWLARNTKPQCNLFFSSNIKNVNTADYVRKNLYEALFDGDNSFISKWGGEVKRTGYTITINDKIGQDKTHLIKIKEALNLTAFNGKSNIDEVTTVIYPIGFNGITTDRVVSKLVNNYSMEFPSLIKYEQVKVREVDEEGNVTQEGVTEEEARAELKRLANLEFTEKHIDQLQFTCDIDYIDLNKFDEYKDLAQLQTANLGDYVSVKVDTFDLEIPARIVARKFDVLMGKRIENTLSTDGELRKPESIKDIIREEFGNTNIVEAFKDLGPYIDDQIQQGFKNGYIVYDKNAVWALDALPKEKAKNVVVLNKKGLGFSSNGVQGPFKYGFTIDGKINADMITVGTLGGQYIKAGSIEADKLSINAKNEITQGLATNSKVTQIEANIDGINAKISNIVQGGNLLKQGVLKGINDPFPWTVGQDLNWRKYDEDHAGIYPTVIDQTERFFESELIPVSVSGQVVSISASLLAEGNTYGAQIYLCGTKTDFKQYDFAHTVASWGAGERAIKSSPNIIIPEGIKNLWVRVDHEGTKNLDGSYYVYIDWINLVKGADNFNEYGLLYGGINKAVSSIKADSNGIKTEVSNVKNGVIGLESNFTQFKQDSQQFQFRVENNTFSNILKNSRPRGWNVDNWYHMTGGSARITNWQGVGETSGENFNGEYFRSGMWLTGNAPNGNGWFILANGSTENYKFNMNKKYTIDFLIYSETPCSYRVEVANVDSSNGVYYSDIIQHYHQGYQRITRTFTPIRNGDKPAFRIACWDFDGRYINWFIPWVNFYEGEKVTNEHVADEKGLVEGLTTIDGNGIKCNFGDGSWASMGRDGFKYKRAEWAHPYQYITKVVKLARIQNGHWQRIYLGDEFKNKRINEDFKLTQYIGAVDCNAFVTTGYYQGALRTAFAEWSDWRASEASLLVRCCIQKIGLKTLKNYGWDSASTSPGAIIGESAGDIIVIAQM